MESFHVPGAGVPMVLLDYLRIQEDSLSERLYLGRSFLARNVEVSIPNQSYPFFLSINVSLDNPEMAAQIANRLVERLAEADRLRQGRATKDPPRNKREQCRKHWTFPLESDSKSWGSIEKGAQPMVDPEWLGGKKDNRL